MEVDENKDAQQQLMEQLFPEVKPEEFMKPKRKSNTKAILLEKIENENQFLISVGSYGWNGIITILGNNNESSIIRTVEETINSIRPCSKKISGKFLTWFQIGGRYFLDSFSSQVSCRGEIIMTQIFQKLLNNHGFRPTFSSNLSAMPCESTDPEFRFFMNNWGNAYKFGDNFYRYWLHKAKYLTSQVGEGSTFFMEKIEKPVGSYECDICCISIKSENSIQIVSPQNLGIEIMKNIDQIAKSTLDSAGIVSGPKTVNGWDVYIVKFADNLFEGPHIMREGTWSSVSTLGRLFFSRLVSEFPGWSFLINGIIKLTTDSIWLIKERTNQIVYQTNPTVDSDRSHAVLSIHEISLIRLYKFSKSAMSAISDVIWENCEIKETQIDKDFEGCFQWKINEKPWSSWGKEAIKGRIIVSKIITKLLEHGYEPETSLSVCRNISRKDSIVFRPISPKSGKFETLFLLMGDSQCLLFCGNISKVEEKIIQEGLKMWPYGVRKNEFVSKFDEIIHKNERCYFVDFEKQPWSVARHQSSHGRIMLQAILSNLKDVGWQLLTSCKLTGECTNASRSSENNEEVTTNAFNFGTSRGCHSLFLVKSSKK